MSPDPIRARLSIVPLEPRHWQRVREIYLQGIATGQATFETAAPEWRAWDAGHLQHSRLVATPAEDESGAAPGRTPAADGQIVGWAALSPVSARKCYMGVAEVTIYIAAEARGRGVGTVLLRELIRASEAAGIWTLQSVVFPENLATIRLHERCGFRVVGRRERMAQRDGAWRDTLLLERRSTLVGARAELASARG